MLKSSLFPWSSSAYKDTNQYLGLSVPRAHTSGVDHLDAGGDSRVAFQHISILLQTGWSQAAAAGMEPTTAENRQKTLADNCLQGTTLH